MACFGGKPYQLKRTSLCWKKCCQNTQLFFYSEKLTKNKQIQKSILLSFAIHWAHTVAEVGMLHAGHRVRIRRICLPLAVHRENVVSLCLGVPDLDAPRQHSRHFAFSSLKLSFKKSFAKGRLPGR